MSDGLRSNIRYCDQEAPLAGSNGAGKIGRSCVGFAEGEVGFVATTLSAKTLRIRNPEIECRALLFTGILKIHADAMCPGRHGEGYFKVALVLRASHVSGEYQVRGWTLRSSLDREDQ